jgi:hypothetical protein
MAAAATWTPADGIARNRVQHQYLALHQHRRHARADVDLHRGRVQPRAFARLRHDILPLLCVSSSAAKVPFCPKISEDRYQFGRLTALKETTPPPES